MKKLLLLFAMILLPMVARADAVEINGIYYYLNSDTKTAGVTSNPKKYSGAIVIPESVTYEGVNYSVTWIGDHAFYECSSLLTITIPNSVTSIGRSVFMNCTSLSSVIIPNSVTSIGNSAFYGCSALASVTIPNSVTSIEGGVFMNCTSLTSITIPNKVTIIKHEAFENCKSLTSVTIGNGIKTVERYAFAFCSGLTDVYCYPINPPNTVTNAFEDSYIDYYATLHVRTESVSRYKGTDPWGYFKEIVALKDSDPKPTDNNSGGGTGSEKCGKPAISYNNGKLIFTSATVGAEYVTTISDADVKTHYGNAISLTATYSISVYATKTGYNNSDIATATLCWIDATPQTEGITNGVAQISSKAVLIQSEGGILKVEGIDDGTQVAVYTPDGKQAGNSVSRNGAALVGTSIQPGNLAIVKIGEKTVKIMVK